VSPCIFFKLCHAQNLTATSITNHLGNVMVVINELPIIDASLGFQTADVVSATDYYPFGLEMVGRTYSASDYAFGFNGKINDEEILSNGRWQDYGFRAYRTDLCRFVSVDPLRDKYPDYSTYTAMGNNPIVMIDPDGRDMVYFNYQGEEVNRIKSNTVFTTYIHTGVSNSIDGVVNPWMEVPMPRIIQNHPNEPNTSATGASYQAYDYEIAAQVGLFNLKKSRNEIVLNTSGGVLIPASVVATIPDLDPTVVKAMCMQESRLGNCDSKSTPKGAYGDLMQVAQMGDWGDWKKQYGIEAEDIFVSPSLSIHAGIRILAMKGFGFEYPTKKEEGKDVPDKSKLAIAKFLGYVVAVENYNGSTNKENYVANVKTMVNDSFSPQKENYTKK
jgi:RHS repeat-associated protein